MELYLDRRFFGTHATIGELQVAAEENNASLLKHVCWTLEDYDRGDDMSKKVPKLTAIPRGRYEIKINHSPKFGIMMPMLYEVPSFIGIRIHWGINEFHTDGCLLVGHAFDIAKWELSRSKAAYDSVYTLIQQAELRGEKVFITIRRENGPHTTH